MYKIGDVADLLAVEKTEIFAKLISHKSLLEPNMKKIDGVTYFDQRAVEVLKTILFKNEETFLDNRAQTQETFDHSSHSPEVVKKKTLSRYEKERNTLLDQIEILKKEIQKLDQEIEVKDQMLLSFQDKLLSDLEMLNRYQTQLLKKNEKALE